MQQTRALAALFFFGITATAHAQPPQESDLAMRIAEAAPGATIHVPAGTSPGGLVLTKPVRLIGDADAPPLIESSGRECIVVQSKGVVIENVNLSFTGTSPMPAVAVESAAELQLTGGEIKSSGATAVRVSGKGSRAVLRRIRIADAQNIALSVTDGGKLRAEDCEIDGVQQIGVLIGDRSGAPASAELVRIRIARANTGVGIFAGSTATIEESEIRDSQTGVTALDKGTRLQLRNTRLTGHKHHAIHVHSRAEVIASDCTIEDNGHGALSGMQRRGRHRARLVLENCRVAGNRVYGIGVGTSSTAVLKRCTLDNETNIHKDAGAKLQMDAATTR